MTKPRSSKTLLRGATVITMARSADEPTVMDILVEGDRIVRLGANLDAADAEILDCSGRVIIPGLINAHMHAWQSALRGIAYNWNLLEYLGNIHFRFAPHFTPKDFYSGTLAGALNQINCGTTTLADWCHNNRTPDHTDAGIDALESAGIRALFLPAAPPAQNSTEQRHPADTAYARSELERLQANRAFGNGDGLLQLGMAVYGPHYAPEDVAFADFRLAKDLGLVISMHHSGGPARAPDTWGLLAADGLLGPNTNIVHGNRIPDDLLRMLVDQGVSFTVTPEVEMGDGHGNPITGRLRDLGSIPSLGVDIESAVSGEMLIVARMALAQQRMLDHDARQADPGHASSPLSARDALEWATLGGARALRQEHRIGSIEPGKQADLVIIDARALNLWPMNDPYTTAVHASLANIEAVMIDGQWRKQNGKLLYSQLDDLRDQLSETVQRVAQLANFALPSTQTPPGENHDD